MASLKEIKGRIASVQSTQKITSAMRMVASAKLHRTQQMTQNFLVYADELEKIISPLIPKADILIQSDTPSNRMDAPLGGRGAVLIPISSGSGLCGAFNSNVAKATLSAIKEYEAKGIKVRILPIGKKIAHDLKREGYECDLEYQLLAESVGKDEVVGLCSELIGYLRDKKESGEIDEVEFLYHHFKSMGKQIITREKLDMSVPTIAPSLTGRAGEGLLYITEPDAQALIAELYPKMLNSKVYSILLDSVTSEHAARMLAMQTADDNAKELLQELTLLYNKSRQQAITNELIDIMGGKVANN